MKVLIVEDSLSMLAIIGRIVESLGATTVKARNGEDALEVLKGSDNQGDGRFDLALVDWNMPKMSGYEFVQAVRGQDLYQSMKIMMITTETEVEQVEKALQAGADEYLMKPFTKDHLQTKLKILGLID